MPDSESGKFVILSILRYNRHSFQSQITGVANAISRRRSFQEIKSRVENGDRFLELDEEEKLAVIAYVGACEVMGRFVHPSELLISGSTLTSPKETLHLISATRKLGYSPITPF